MVNYFLTVDKYYYYYSLLLHHEEAEINVKHQKKYRKQRTEQKGVYRVKKIQEYFRT